MKKITLLLLISLISFIKQTRATHVIGAELTYTCLGNGQYEATYTFYRDCLGIDAPQMIVMDITNSCGFPSQTINLLPDLSTGNRVNEICSNLLSTCEGGIEPGIQKWIYRGIVTLLSECDEWNFSCAVSTRNASITTFVDPDFNNLFVFASVNNADGLCNNSPVFENLPVFYSCVGQAFCIEPGITDIEGDSISVTLIAPLADENTSLTNEPGYSPLQFLTSSPITFDAETGNACVHATASEVGIVAILVSEYREGLLISRVERDYQIDIYNCQNNLPELSGIDNTFSYDLSVCSGDSVCFNISSSDNDATDSTWISIVNGIPGSTFNVMTGQSETAQFCWATFAADTLNNPHTLDVMVRDNNCFVEGSKIFRYNITVHDDLLTCILLSSEETKISGSEIKIYPQPASDKINVHLSSEIIKGGKTQMELANITGVIVYRSLLQNEITILKTDILEGGIYFLKITNPDLSFVRSQKIIVGR